MWQLNKTKLGSLENKVCGTHLTKLLPCQACLSRGTGLGLSHHWPSQVQISLAVENLSQALPRLIYLDASHIVYFCTQNSLLGLDLFFSSDTLNCSHQQNTPRSRAKSEGIEDKSDRSQANHHFKFPRQLTIPTNSTNPRRINIHTQYQTNQTLCTYSIPLDYTTASTNCTGKILQ